MKALCFVLMPFGRKPAPNGAVIDFDRVYLELIQPAVLAAELEPLRADEETIGGGIHKPMFERLILCPYAVADLTLANANVFYELGIRHSFKPFGNVTVVAKDSHLPFDVQMYRVVAYVLGADGAPEPAHVENTRQAISRLLAEARKGRYDSPVFKLLDRLEPPQLLQADATDSFREQVEYSNQVKSKLASARKSGVDAVRNVEKDLAAIANLEPGVLIDLFLSYRAVASWQDMVRLHKEMAHAMAETVLVREQLGLALNRLKRRDEAEGVLTKLIDERGPSSETLGILGRVFRDAWEEAQETDEILASGYLQKGIDAYLAGFEADWRDAYPGVNAVTLMEIQDPPDERRFTIVPVVRYSVERKVEKGKPDYWDWATLLELAVIALDQAQAAKLLPKAVAQIRERWEPETTARNLRVIREARERQDRAPAWAAEIERVLVQRAGA